MQKQEVYFSVREAHNRTLVEDTLDSLLPPSACVLASRTFWTKAPKPMNKYKYVYIVYLLGNFRQAYQRKRGDIMSRKRSERGISYHLSYP
jgi:hypothetical protein